MNHSRPQKKKNRRKGVWEQVEVIQDPDSKVTLILSEQIRGKPAYSIQLVVEDDLGMNKHIQLPPKGAKHELKHIVYSLVDRAQEIIAERKKAAAKKPS